MVSNLRETVVKTGLHESHQHQQTFAKRRLIDNRRTLPGIGHGFDLRLRGFSLGQQFELRFVLRSQTDGEVPGRVVVLFNLFESRLGRVQSLTVINPSGGHFLEGPLQLGRVGAIAKVHGFQLVNAPLGGGDSLGERFELLAQLCGRRERIGLQRPGLRIHFVSRLAFRILGSRTLVPSSRLNARRFQGRVDRDSQFRFFLRLPSFSLTALRGITNDRHHDHVPLARLADVDRHSLHRIQALDELAVARIFSESRQDLRAAIEINDDVIRFRCHTDVFWRFKGRRLAARSVVQRSRLLVSGFDLQDLGLRYGVGGLESSYQFQKTLK